MSDVQKTQSGIRGKKKKKKKRHALKITGVFRLDSAAQGSCWCYLKYLKCVESVFCPPIFSLPSHHVSAFPSADCLKGRGGHFIHKCRDSNGTPLYMPRLWRLAPDFTCPTPALPPPPYFTLQIPEAPQRLCAERRHKNKMKKKRKTSCFISLLTLYNVVNACFNPPSPLLFLCALLSHRVGSRRSSSRGLAENPAMAEFPHSVQFKGVLY